MRETTDVLDIVIKIGHGDSKAQIRSLETDIKGLSNAFKKAASENEKAAASSKKAVENTSKSFTGFNLNTRRMYRNLMKAANVAADWFKESNDYIEALNLFSVTMGKNADEAKAYAETLQNLMGIDIKEWMNYQGSFNQMLMGFGIDNDRATQMSQQLTQISYDLSSLWNTDVQTAFQKVQSGMSGQVKGLKAWGINLSIAQLRETALAHGITLSTARMTEAQKSMLRYITIMEKTANVQGDLARTIVTPANAMRILGQQMTQLKRAMGNIVSVLVVQFIPYVQLAVNWLTELANSLAERFGFELPEIDYSGLDTAALYADDLEDSLDEAEDEAKKLKKTLLGFDEINKLNGASDLSSSAILGGGLPSDLGLWDYAQTLGYDFTKGIKLPDFDAIKEKLKDILWYIGAIGAGILAWKLGTALNALGLIEVGLGAILGAALSVVGAIVLIKGAIDSVKDGIDKNSLLEMLGGWAVLVAGLALAFGGVGAAIGAVIGAVVLLGVGIHDALENGLNEYNKFAIVAGTGFSVPVLLVLDLIENVTGRKEKGTKAVSSVFSFFKSYIDGWVIPLSQVAGRFMQNWIFVIQNVWQNAKTVFDGITNGVTTIFNKIGEINRVLITNIKILWSPLSDWLSTKLFNPLEQRFSSFTSRIKSRAQNLLDFGKEKAIQFSNSIAIAFAKVMNGLFTLIENKINFFISGLNAFSKLVGNDQIIQPLRIPRIEVNKYAEGGFPDRGSLFIAREAGAEMVGSIGNKTAVANNDQIVAAIEGGVYRGVRDAIGTQSDDRQLVVMIGNDVVYKGFAKWHNDEVKVTGRSPLTT